MSATTPGPFDLEDEEGLRAAVAAVGSELVLLTTNAGGMTSAVNMALQLRRVHLTAVLVLPALRRLEQRQHVPLVVQRMDLQPAGVPRLRDLHGWWRRRHWIATAAAAATHVCAVVQPLDLPEPSVLVLRDLRRRRRLAAAHAGRLAAHRLVAPSAAHVRKPGLLAM